MATCSSQAKWFCDRFRSVFMRVHSPGQSAIRIFVLAQEVPIEIVFSIREPNVILDIICVQVIRELTIRLGHDIEVIIWEKFQLQQALPLQWDQVIFQLHVFPYSPGPFLLPRRSSGLCMHGIKFRVPVSVSIWRDISLTISWFAHFLARSPRMRSRKLASLKPVYVHFLRVRLHSWSMLHSSNRSMGLGWGAPLTWLFPKYEYPPSKFAETDCIKSQLWRPENAEPLAQSQAWEFKLMFFSTCSCQFCPLHFRVHCRRTERGQRWARIWTCSAILI